MIASEIIKTALLGTEKYVPQPLPNLKSVSEKISQQSTDKEDAFLKNSVTTLLYIEAGNSAKEISTEMPVCPTETLPITNERLANFIQTALLSNDDIMFEYGIFNCNQGEKVVAPQLIPQILNKALANKKSSQHLIQSCGERGKWLCSLNKNWHCFFDDSNEENVWELGNFENRKKYLIEARNNDPALALSLLENSIASENANNRIEFIELLAHNLSINDEDFLQNIVKNDKSQKAKDSALGLLRVITDSNINNMYMDYLLKNLEIKEERHLLLSKKKTIAINENPTIEEDLFKTGIQKVSDKKGVKDAIFIIGQLISYINPTQLALKLNIAEEELLNLFVQHKGWKTLVPFIIEAAVKFKNASWSTTLLTNKELNAVELLNALPLSHRSNYYEQFIDANLQGLLYYIFDENYTSLNLSLAKKILEHLSKNPYVFTKNNYQRLALHLPTSVEPILQQYSFDINEDYQAKYFRNQIFEIIRIIDLKKNIQ